MEMNCCCFVLVFLSCSAASTQSGILAPPGPPSPPDDESTDSTSTRQAGASLTSPTSVTNERITTTTKHRFDSLETTRGRTTTPTAPDYDTSERRTTKREISTTSLLDSDFDSSESEATTRRPFINLGGGIDGRSGDCFRDFPQLAQRFTWEQLEFFCQQKRVFDEVIYGNETITPFTDNQQRYLDQFKMDLNKTNDSQTLSLRQEIRSMSDQNRRLFNFALSSLKKSRIDGVSKYDLIVMLMHPALAPGAHVGAAYLPWHREYLRLFELALRNEHPDVIGLPYWDSTLDSPLPQARDSVVWQSQFFGNDRGLVVTGPFASVEFIPPNRTEAIPLRRNASLAGALFTTDNVTKFLNAQTFRHLTACIDPWLEQSSRGVHQWVGGAMGDMYYSAQDFVYFLHYAFLDKLWEQFRQGQSDNDRVYGYPANYEACTKFHFGHSPMRPFEPLRNLDGLSDAYMLYYRYVDSPSECRNNADCVSKFLFCNHLDHGSVCTSKIRIGGDCSGLAEYDPCFDGRCVNDLCFALPSTGRSTRTENNDNIQ